MRVGSVGNITCRLQSVFRSNQRTAQGINPVLPGPFLRPRFSTWATPDYRKQDTSSILRTAGIRTQFTSVDD